MPPHHEATQDACSSIRMYVHPALGIDSGMGIAVAMAMAIGMACYVACCMAVWLYGCITLFPPTYGATRAMTWFYI